jgi:hypothetical protein
MTLAYTNALHAYFLAGWLSQRRSRCWLAWVESMMPEQQVDTMTGSIAAANLLNTK